MSGIIIFGDGRAWAVRNRAFDMALEAIADQLPPDAHALAEWLLDRRSSLRGPGMGRLDLRELTPANERLLLDTMERVFFVTSPEPPADWWELDRYELLGHMLRAYRRGEPPGLLNPHMRELLPPRGWRSGPGWAKPTGEAEMLDQLAKRFSISVERLRRGARLGKFRARKLGGRWYAEPIAVAYWTNPQTAQTARERNPLPPFLCAAKLGETSAH